MLGKLIIVYLICFFKVVAQGQQFISGKWRLASSNNSTNQAIGLITSLLQQNSGICSLFQFSFSNSFNSIRVSLYDKQPQLSDFIKDYFSSSDEYDNHNFNVSSIIPKKESISRQITILMTFSFRDVKDYDIIESVSAEVSFEVKEVNYKLNSVNILENQNTKISRLLNNVSTIIHFNRLTNQIILSNSELYLTISEFTLVAYMVFLQTLIIVVCCVAFVLIQFVIRRLEDQFPKAQMANILMLLYIGFLLRGNCYFTRTELSSLMFFFRKGVVNVVLLFLMVGLFLGITCGPYLDRLARYANLYITIVYKIILALLILFSPTSWNIYIIAFAFVWQIYSMFTSSIKQPIENLFFDLFYVFFVILMVFLMRFVELVYTPFNKTTEHNILIFVLLSQMVFNFINHRLSFLELIHRLRIKVKQMKFVDLTNKCAECKQSINQNELIQKPIASGEMMVNNIPLEAPCGHIFHKSCSQKISGMICPIDKISLGQHFGQ